ncbi:MAG: DUF4407 domain-containing protein [Rhodoferax sp.]|nr:DUF4407 domain-containing protein [Rhodoferax sp.]
MTTPQNISSYLCHVVGETPQRAARFHASTVRRTKAFAIAIHIPVLLWAVTGFVIASQIFRQSQVASAGVALMCAGLIYLVERLVLATPKVWFVNVSRVLIGLVISVLGASTVDLVIFDREIAEQLLLTGEATLLAEHGALLATQANTVAQKKTDWLKAQEAANCEANGTCGSKPMETRTTIINHPTNLSAKGSINRTQRFGFPTMRLAGFASLPLMTMAMKV